jgi:zinc protease
MAAEPEPIVGPIRWPSWRGLYDFTLKNGLRVLFVQRNRSTVVEFRLIVDGGGFAADPARRSGLAAAATSLFSEGLLHVNGAQLSSAFDELGALPKCRVTPDAAVIGVSALNANFRDALRIWVKAVAHPEFNPDNFELLQTNQLALVARERLNPFDLALRVLPPVIYDRGHIYARPFSGSGTANGIAEITPDDLQTYYATHLAPQSATLVVVASCETADLRYWLEQTFGEWRPQPEIPLPTQVPLPMQTTETLEAGPSTVIVNRPGTSQTVLAAGLRTVARNSIHADPLIVADTILAGIFTSRLNSSLRERKGWTYGVRSSVLDARLQGIWLILTAVREDRAIQAMAEIASAIENLAAPNQLSQEEFSRAISYLVARTPLQSETCGQMADLFANVRINRLPTSYPETAPTHFSGLTPVKVTETWRHVLAASTLKWLAVGEAAELHNRLRMAGFSNIEIIEPSTELS